MKRKLILFALVVGVSFLLSPPATADVRIGILLPGHIFGDLNKEAKEGINAAVRELSQRRSLQVFAAEYQNPAEAVVRLNELAVREKVQIFIGPADLRALLAVRETVNKDNLLLFPIGLNYSLPPTPPPGIIQIVSIDNENKISSTKEITQSLIQIIYQSYVATGSSNSDDISRYIKTTQRSFNTSAGAVIFRQGRLNCERCTGVICTTPKIVCKNDSSKCCDP